MLLEYKFGDDYYSFEADDEKVIKILKKIYSDENKSEDEQLKDVVENVLSEQQIQTKLKNSGCKTLEDYLSKYEIDIIDYLSDSDIDEIEYEFEEEAYDEYRW